MKRVISICLLACLPLTFLLFLGVSTTAKYLEERISFLTIASHVGYVDTIQWMVEKKISNLKRDKIHYLPKGILSENTTGYWTPETYSNLEKSPQYKTINALGVSDYPISLYSDSDYEFSSWTRSNGNLFSTKFSSLTQINTDNVVKLQPKWTYKSGDGIWPCCGESTYLNVETNPIYLDGKLITTTPNLSLIAINVDNGKEIWRFKAPGVPARRGLIYRQGNDAIPSRIYLNFGNRLYAINPETGKPDLSFSPRGYVKSGKSLIAPVLTKNSIIVATTKPSLAAFSLENGEKVWETGLLDRSGVVPDGGSNFRIGGGVPWGGMSLDPARGMVFIVTGNARPSLWGALRPGPNKHSNSVIAVDAESGRIIWSFQEVAHDLWDFDIASPPILTTIRTNDKRIDVVIAVTKIGNSLILDRVNGKPIFDYRLRLAPESMVPGEKTANWQPSLISPEPFSDNEFGLDDITDIGFENREDIKRKLKNAQFGFFMPPNIGRSTISFGIHGGAQWPGGSVDHNKQLLFVPSSQLPWVSFVEFTNPRNLAIAHSGSEKYQQHCASCHGSDRAGKKFLRPISQQPSLLGISQRDFRLPVPSLLGISFARKPTELKDIKKFFQTHSEEKLAQIDEKTLEEIISYFAAHDEFIDQEGGFSVSYHWEQLLDNQGYPGSKPPWGSITAIDLNSGQIKWKIPFGEFKELSDRGIPITGQPNYAGLLSTGGGLVFATGTIDAKVRAFKSETGEELWSYKMPAGGSAPPTTFMHNGQQHVAIVATGPRFRQFNHSDEIFMFVIP